MSEAPRPARIVDAHVHLWDPARTDWYPYLSGDQQLGMGDVTGMARRFDAATYRAEAGAWNVDKLVHVAAATGAHSISETLEVDGRGEAAAIIGGVTPTDSVAAAIDQLDRQMAAERFRGVRPMGAFEGPLPSAEVLQGLSDRGLVFEVLARPKHLETAAAGLARFEDLVVVVEHAGWLKSGSDEERKVWQRGMAALAGLGPNVHCKLSGLAVPLGSMRPDALAPWIEPCLELFGVERCFFASNFPVDGLGGGLEELWDGFNALTADLDDRARDQLFAANAERIYRC